MDENINYLYRMLFNELNVNNTKAIELKLNAIFHIMKQNPVFNDAVNIRYKEYEKQYNDYNEKYGPCVMCKVLGNK